MKTFKHKFLSFSKSISAESLWRAKTSLPLNFVFNAFDFRGLTLTYGELVIPYVAMQYRAYVLSGKIHLALF